MLLFDITLNLIAVSGITILSLLFVLSYAINVIVIAIIVSILEIVSFSLIISLYRVNNRLVAIFERQIPNYKELLDEWKNRKVN